MHTLFTLLAGLGLIFIGTQFLTANMKQVAGARFHRLVAGATRHPLRAAGVGVAAGAVIQSTNAVTFIIVGLIAAGATTVKAAMPIVTWSYAGSTLRLLLVSVDLGLVTLILLALVGLAFLLGYDRDGRWRHMVGAALGLTLLLYGVQTMVDGSQPLRHSETLRDILAFADRFYLWGFIAGTLLASVIQGQTLSVIAIALTQGGLLGLDQTMLLVVGANLGAGIQAVAQGAGLAGTTRQLNLYQLVLKLIGVGIMLPLLMLEHWGGVPTVRSLAGWISGDLGIQVTLVHWMFQISAALAASLMSGPLFRLIERWSPATAAETLSKPAFIAPAAAAQADVALEMVEQEQLRLLRRMPDFLAGLHADSPGPAAVPVATLRDSGDELSRAIDAFLKASLQHPMPPELLDRLMRRWNFNEELPVMHNALAQFAATLPRAGTQPGAVRITTTLVEALHALLVILAEEAAGGDVAGPDLMERLTSDRTAMMRQLREDLVRSSPDLPVAERQAIWRLTDMFERVTWAMRRLMLNLDPPAAA